MSKLRFPDWPIYDEAERAALMDVLESREWWMGGGNSAAARFERDFAASHGTRRGITTTNGTHAIELALRALDIGPGDEVIIPSMTFIATASAVFCVGARPVPVDVDLATWCVAPEAVKQAIGPRTKAVMVVHFGGLICDMAAIGAICRHHGVALIEDAAHAHGAERQGRRTGSFGIAAAFSFQNFKLMTAGEGGILVTNDDALADRAEMIANCGRRRGDPSYDHAVMGSNFRLSAFQAAILSAQLARLETLAERRRENGLALDRALAAIASVIPQGDDSDGRHARYMYLLRVPIDRDGLVAHLADRGVPARPIYPRVQDTTLFRIGDALATADGDFTVLPPCPAAARIADEGLWLHHRVLLGDLDTALRVADAIADFWRKGGE